MEAFEISVSYQGKEMVFNAELLQFGYVYKIIIYVNGQQISVEKDDEGNYRAILIDIEAESKIDKDLVRAIVESIDKILK